MCYDQWINLAVAIGTVGAVVLVVVKDFILAWCKRPIISCELENPPIYLTKLRNQNGLIEKKYCRLVIRNTGKTSLKTVEVMITDLKIQEGDKFVLVDSFFPDNLIWGLGQDRTDLFNNLNRDYREEQIYYPYISPHTRQLCNLGNIIDEITRMHINEKYGDKIFEINVRFKSNNLYYLLKRGKYHAEITIGAENANAIKKYFEMNISETDFEIKEIQINVS